MESGALARRSDLFTPSQRSRTAGGEPAGGVGGRRAVCGWSVRTIFS
jgi:hypothetical protein